MIFTKELLEKGKSSNGGWNKEQVNLLGEDMKIKGWAYRMVGKEVPDSIVAEFLRLKDFHFKRKHEKGLPVKKKFLVANHILNFAPVTSRLTHQSQYLHPNWQMMRLHVFQRDNYTCVDCGSIDKTLHAHHLKYIRDKYVWEVPHWYIVTLCEDCHSKEHGRDLRAH